MKTLTEPTIQVDIFMAGPIEQAKFTCQEYCSDIGLCVTITSTTFAYKYGSEDGFIVGLRNYPRFPSTRENLLKRASDLAMYLLVKLNQGSCMIVSDKTTTWYTRRPADL